MTIPEDYLALTLANVLALHDPRRAYHGASVEQLSAALLALEARIHRAPNVAGPRGAAKPSAA